ncbi:MarR family winged helix-turn-helix transcriptional regulator [Streptomyces sp. NPDC088137]|uniref:MarR family winged helix-turn-helix transcriptional regulator n=2 Tax=Streptomyces TaxID=1883 RepID=UPI003821A777
MSSRRPRPSPPGAHGPSPHPAVRGVRGGMVPDGRVPDGRECGGPRWRWWGPEALQSFAPATRHLSLLSYPLFDGPMTVNELAARLQVAPTAVSLLVGDLSRKGILERRGDEADRRRRIIGIAADQQPAITAWLAPGCGCVAQGIGPADTGISDSCSSTRCSRTKPRWQCGSRLNRAHSHRRPRAADIRGVIDCIHRVVTATSVKGAPSVRSPDPCRPPAPHRPERHR